MLKNTKESNTIEKAFIDLYPEIKNIAYGQLNRLQPGKTISATVLVNECYLKLHKKIKLQISSEKHFYCLIAKCMKQFLIDQIRGKNRSKRSAEMQSNIVSQVVGEQDVNFKLIEIITVVDQLEVINSELAEIVNLHCFGGFTFDEISLSLNKSKRQLMRKWKVAKSIILSLLDENHDN